MAVLSGDQHAKLACISQDYELSVAFTSSFNMTAVSTPVMFTVVRTSASTDPVDVQLQEVVPITWTSIPRISCSRIGIVGQEMHFYGGDSYVRGGGAAGGHSWNFGDGNGSGNASTSHSYGAAGEYEVTLSVDGQLEPARRKVRVLNAWTDGLPVVSISGPSGKTSGGWQAELTIPLDSGNGSSVSDGAGCIVYCRDFWEVSDGNWVEESIGPERDRYDERLVMFGYVVGSSIEENPDTHVVTFSIRTPEVYLQNFMFKNFQFYTAVVSGGGFGCNGFGDYIVNLATTDAIHHLITHHTNFSVWHSLILAQINTGVSDVTANEGFLWQQINSLMQPDFGVVYCNKFGDLYCVPHVNMYSNWWGSIGVVQDFNDTTILQISAQETWVKAVGRVQLEGNKSTMGQILTAVHDSGNGPWEIIKGLLQNDQARLNLYADNLYTWRNARWRVSLVTGLNHALDLFQVISISHTDANGRYSWSGKQFVIVAITHAFDIASRTTRTTIEAEEKVT